MNSTKLPRWPVPLLSGNNYKHPVSFDPAESSAGYTRKLTFIDQTHHIFQERIIGKLK